MKKEVEAKFLDVDHNDLRQKLRMLGADQVTPMFLMRRVMMDFPDRRLNANKAFVRVRQEYNRVTMAFKQIEDLKIDGVNEAETEVGTFNEAVDFCRALGLVVLSRQESKREIWQKGSAEIVLDEWPWLKPYAEIEAPTKDLVYATANTLSLDIQAAVYGDIMSAYRAQYPGTDPAFLISDLPLVRFEDSNPPDLKH